MTTTLIWTVSEVVAALVLLVALILFVKVYREMDEVVVADWQLVAIGVGLFLTVRTSFSVFSTVSHLPIAAYPRHVVVLLGLALLAAATMVFIGLYRIAGRRDLL